jgi:17beta-estradiol 17-dehydrogenase / very-long-chain 3-oxoacyl-CoA reductase
VVTGSTDGIGKGYAKALAKKGINLYLVSRSEDKLKATADEIRKINSNVEIRTLSVDFKKATPATYKTTVANAFKDLEIGILINNVGMGYVYPEALASIKDSEEFLQDIVMVNDISCLQMTRVVLPQMLSRKRGAIVNISSAAAFSPVPCLTIYSATKIFMDFITTGFRTEYADSGVIFQVVNPFYVVTKMSGLSRSSFWAPDPDDYAANALDTIGLLNATSGCLSHEIQRVGMKLLYSIVPQKKIGNMMKDIVLQNKEKYLRRLEKEKQK